MNELREKPIASFAANCRQTISGTWSYIKISKADWLEDIAIWAPFEKLKVEAYIFVRASPLDLTATKTFLS